MAAAGMSRKISGVTGGLVVVLAATAMLSSGAAVASAQSSYDPAWSGPADGFYFLPGPAFPGLAQCGSLQRFIPSQAFQLPVQETNGAIDQFPFPVQETESLISDFLLFAENCLPQVNEQ